MTTINELLQQLSEIEPEFCENVAADIYAMGIYRFQYYDDTLHAWEVGFTYTCTGEPAHDWLQGALQREIARRGWGLNTKHRGQQVTAMIVKPTPEKDVLCRGNGETLAHALLTALIAALGAATSPAGDAGE